MKKPLLLGLCLLAFAFSGSAWAQKKTLAVVVKGSDSAIDELFSLEGHQILRGARLARSPLHHRGTGCRFGSGLAAGLARGDDLLTATRRARRLVRKFLARPILS